MKLLQDLWTHLKEWSDWGMKDWIKARYRSHNRNYCSTVNNGCLMKPFVDRQTKYMNLQKAARQERAAEERNFMKNFNPIQRSVKILQDSEKT